MLKLKNVCQHYVAAQWVFEKQKYTLVWCGYYSLFYLPSRKYLKQLLIIITCNSIFLSCFCTCTRYRDYFMERAYIRDFHTSWWSIGNWTSERSERVRFLIQNQRVWKSRTKRFPCCNLFILYMVRFFFIYPALIAWFSKIITKLLY